MFRFGSASALYGLLLIPLLAVFLWSALRARRRALERFGDVLLVRRLTESVSHRARVVKPLLLVAGVALLVSSLARPQFGTRVETVRCEGKDVVVAMDLSRSMLAEDVAPQQAAKGQARDPSASPATRRRPNRSGGVRRPSVRAESADDRLRGGEPVPQRNGRRLGPRSGNQSGGGARRLPGRVR